MDQNITDSEAISQSWHRQPSIWLVIGILGFTMVASFGLLYLAMANAPDLSVADYSRIESIAAEEQSRRARATELGLKAAIEFNNTNPARIIVKVEALEQPEWTDSLRLRVVHTTLPAFDSESVLRGANGSYAGFVTLPPGSFQLVLEDMSGTWQLSQRTHIDQQGIEMGRSESGP